MSQSPNRLVATVFGAVYLLVGVLGLFVAGVLRAEATLAAANLVYLLLMAGGAVVLAGCDDLTSDRVVSPTDGVEPDDPATWPADTPLLISARQRVYGYRLGLDAVGAGSSDVARELDGLWRTQQERLELLITLGGVPLPHLHDEPAVAVAGSGDPTGSTSSPASCAACGWPGSPAASGRATWARCVSCCWRDTPSFRARAV